MDHLPLVHRAWVHLADESSPTALAGPVIQSGTLGAMIRWMHDQPETDRIRFVVGIQHMRSPVTYRDLEVMATRSGVLGNDLHQRSAMG
jgi:hypothetical protein